MPDLFEIVNSIIIVCVVYLQTDTTAKSLLKRPKIQEAFDHVMIQHQYHMFLKKCGESVCSLKLCRPPRLPRDVFDSLCQLPGNQMAY